MRGVATELCAVSTPALVGAEWSRSGPGRLTPGEGAQGAHCIESRVGGTQDRCRELEKGKIYYICRESNHDSSALLVHGLVTTTAALSRLQSDYFQIKKNQQLLKERQETNTKDEV
jgi:hypothetical protein